MLRTIRRFLLCLVTVGSLLLPALPAAGTPQFPRQTASSLLAAAFDWLTDLASRPEQARAARFADSTPGVDDAPPPALAPPIHDRGVLSAVNGESDVAPALDPDG